MNRVDKVDFDTQKIRNTSSTENFLKTGKIDLFYKKIEIQDPVFVHFEFDN